MYLQGDVHCRSISRFPLSLTAICLTELVVLKACLSAIKKGPPSQLACKGMENTRRSLASTLGEQRTSDWFGACGVDQNTFSPPGRLPCPFLILSGLKMLAVSLFENDTLSSVDLSYNSVTPSAAMVLAFALKVQVWIRLCTRPVKANEG